MAVSIGEIFARLSLDDQMTAALGKASSALQAYEGKWQSIGAGMTQAGTAITAGITVPIAAVGAASIKAAIDFESAFAGVRKTVDATEPEFAELSQGFRDMAMELPTSVEQLLAVGEAAGQLGIKKEDILQFTRTMADLGETTNLTADEAATATAQIQNIFGAAGVDVDRFGSTLVALGNAGASTERDIISMGLRIAGAGQQVGLSQAEVLSFASALSSVGVEAESGGTAISRTFLTINDAVMSGGGALNEFARIAGMSSTQFAQAFRDDAAGATTAFISGLNRIKGEGENLNQVLGNLELGEIRVRDALLRSTGAHKMLTEQLDLGKKAWEENTALTEEAEKRYATTEAELKKLWNQLKDVATEFGQSLIPAVRGMIDAAGPLIDGLRLAVDLFGALPAPLQLTIVGLAGAAAAIGPLVWGIGQMITAGTAIGGVLVTLTGATSGWAAATGLATSALGFLGPAIAVVATAVAAWNIGEWIGEMTGATDAIADMAASVGEFIGLLPEGTSKMRELDRATRDQLPTVKAAGAGFTAVNDAARVAAGGMAVFDQQVQQAAGGGTNALLAQLRAGEAQLAKLDAATKSQVAEALKLGATAKEVASEFGLNEQAVANYEKALGKSASTAKTTGDAYKRMLDQLQGTTATEDALSLVRAIEKIGGATRVTEEDARRFAGQLTDVIERSIALGQAAPPEIVKMAISLDGMATAANDAKTGMDLLAANIDKVALKAPALASTKLDLSAFLEPLKGAATSSLGKSLGERMMADLGQTLRTQLGPTIMAAFTGGGNVGESVGGLIGGSLFKPGGAAEKAITGGLSKLLGKGIGAAVGSVIPGLGTLVGGALGGVIGKLGGSLFGKLFGGGEGKKVNDLRDDFVKASGGIHELNVKAQAAGLTLDRLLNAKKVDDFNAAVQELQQGIAGNAANLDLARQAAEQFGIPMERMGAAFKQAETDLSSADLLSKINALVASGVDLGTVVEFAGDDVGEFIKRAMEMGTTVPLEFKKIAQQMAEAGTLIDANGEKLNVEDVPWATSMEEKFSSLIDKLDLFIDGLGRIPDAINIDVNYNKTGDVPGPDVDLTPMAEGGLVRGPTAILAGEAGPELITPLNRLGEFGGGADAATLAEMQAINRNLQKVLAQQPALIAKATRDALRGAATGRS